MGKRIRQIRTRAGLRQWELAKCLGTTQSAVHKYEHGVVPEPRRLVELAKVGETSIEWILTGNHWENGSEEQERVSPDLLLTASLLRGIEPSERSSVDEALRILQEAVRVLAAGDEAESTFLSHPRETLQVLEEARKIQQAVLKQVLRQTEHRFGDSTLLRRPGKDGKKNP